MEDDITDHLISVLSNASSMQGYKTIEMEEDHIEHVLHKVKDILLARPMLLEIEAPTYVFGDIHGQFYDLLQTFRLCGDPSEENQMLFLGDYVDRGRFGLETVILLFCYKITLPDHFHMLRGNHESKSVSRVYGFYEECTKRYNNPNLWRQFIEVFDCMPVACVISKVILCMHGGLSPHLHTLDDIRDMARPTDIPPGGLMADLLWADPDKKLKAGWAENPRGVSFIFAADVVTQFCEQFSIDVIIRAHQVVHQGYELFADGKLITLFTAPNFCGQFENMGAMMKIEKHLKMSLTFMDGRKKGKESKPTKTLQPKTPPSNKPAASKPVDNDNEEDDDDEDDEKHVDKDKMNKTVTRKEGVSMGMRDVFGSIFRVKRGGSKREKLGTTYSHSGGSKPGKLSKSPCGGGGSKRGKLGSTRSSGGSKREQLGLSPSPRGSKNEKLGTNSGNGGSKRGKLGTGAGSGGSKRGKLGGSPGGGSKRGKLGGSPGGGSKRGKLGGSPGGGSKRGKLGTMAGNSKSGSQREKLGSKRGSKREKLGQAPSPGGGSKREKLSPAPAPGNVSKNLDPKKANTLYSNTSPQPKK